MNTARNEGTPKSGGPGATHHCGQEERISTQCASETRTKYEWARLHYSRGWNVIPGHSLTAGGRCTCGNRNCSSPGKHPRIDWDEYATRRSTVEELAEWWRRWSDANIAAVTGHTSGRAVLDIDGEQGWLSLLEAGIELPPTVTVESGRDYAAHMHFTYPEAAEIPSAVGVFPKVDVRADPGIIILPGSDHVSGKVYRFKEGHSPDDLEEAPFPGEIRSLLKANKPKPIGQATVKPACKYTPARDAYCQAALEEECAKVAAAPEGERNSTLNAAAFVIGTLVGAGFPERGAIAALNRAGLACGLPADEVERTVVRSLEEGRAKPRDLSEIKAEKPTIAQRVVKLASRHQYFHDEMDRGYALVEQGGRTRCLPIRSRAFAKMLSHDFHKSAGSVLSANNHRDAVGLLEARALFEGERRDVFRRIARVGGTVYVDLCDDEYRVVEVSRDGWRVLASSPVTFVRGDSMKPLPVPVADGSIEDLRPLVNLGDDDQWVLFVGWLLGALRPEGPYPILIIQGEHGSAKSTLARFTRALVDPDVAEVCRPPKNDRDLMISATHGHLLVFDNLSGLSGDLADTLCSLATGTGMRTRVLYTDDEETVLQASRPIVLNGIESLTAREDIASRAVVLHLPYIGEGGRRTERDVVGAFEDLRPKLFGALLDALSCALAHEGDADPTELPRMADFAKWVNGAEGALGWESGTFIKAFRRNYDESVCQAIDTDPVASFLIRAIAEHGEFTGSTQDLLAYMNRSVTSDTSHLTDWPKNYNQLSARLKRIEPLLRRTGIGVERPGRTGRTRSLRIGRIGTAGETTSEDNRSVASEGPTLFPRIGPSRQERAAG